MASGSGRHEWNINRNRTRERSQRLKNAAPSGKTDRQLIDEHIATRGVTVCRPGTARTLRSRRRDTSPADANHDTRRSILGLSNCLRHIGRSNATTSITPPFLATSH
jgi:hypothetical protein